MPLVVPRGGLFAVRKQANFGVSKAKSTSLDKYQSKYPINKSYAEARFILTL